jgi:hypothetical protein
MDTLLELMRAQFKKDIQSRADDLKTCLRMAKKAGMDSYLPAREFCGSFSGLSADLRLCEVPDYIAFLEERVCECE